MNRLRLYLAFLLDLLSWVVLEIFGTGVILAQRALGVGMECFSGRRPGIVGPYADQGKGAVLLIHGLSMDHRIMATLTWRLKRAGWGPIYRLNLGPRSWTIEKHGELFAEKLRELAEKHGPIHVIGHSMGGLVARHGMQRLGVASQMKSLVTLATPHFGTPMARLAFTTSGRQLRLTSDFMRELSVCEWPAAIPTLFLFSNLDALVPHAWGGPPTAERKLDEKIVKAWRYLPMHGHNSILLSRRAFKEVDSFLAGL